MKSLCNHKVSLELQLKQMNEVRGAMMKTKKVVIDELTEVISVICRASNVTLNKALVKLESAEASGEKKMQYFKQRINCLLNEATELSQVKNELHDIAVSAVLHKIVNLLLPPF